MQLVPDTRALICARTCLALTPEVCLVLLGDGASMTTEMIQAAIQKLMETKFSATFNEIPLFMMSRLRVLEASLQHHKYIFDPAFV